MSNTIPLNVMPPAGQVKKLFNAYKKKAGTVIQILPAQLNGENVLHVSQRMFNKVMKNANFRKGTNIKPSLDHVKKTMEGV